MVLQVYEILNKAWESTCKILLKEEVGDLKEFRNYLDLIIFVCVCLMQVPTLDFLTFQEMPLENAKVAQLVRAPDS